LNPQPRFTNGISFSLFEIRCAHVKWTKQLLSQTDLPMTVIADCGGFLSAVWFHDVAGEMQSRRRFAFH
jgi:hypothetical protein